MSTSKVQRTLQRPGASSTTRVRAVKVSGMCPGNPEYTAQAAGGGVLLGGAVMMWMEHILVQNPNLTQRPLNYWDGRGGLEAPTGAIGATSLSKLSPVPVQLLSCVQLFATMDYSIPGFPVHHQFLELTQTNIH